MRKKIRVTAIPPGFAGEHIRKQFVGLVIPVASEEELKANPPSSFLRDAEGKMPGHLVRRSDAIEAFVSAGKLGAAHFFRVTGMGHYIPISHEVSELVE